MTHPFMGVPPTGCAHGLGHGEIACAGHPGGGKLPASAAQRRRGGAMRTQRRLPHPSSLPWWRGELPFGLLAAAAIASPLLMLDQGGDWHDAVLSFCVVLGLPGAAVESMTGVARLALLLRAGDA
jgi:hypothetical protein